MISASRRWRNRKARMDGSAGPPTLRLSHHIIKAPSALAEIIRRPRCDSNFPIWAHLLGFIAWNQFIFTVDIICGEYVEESHLPVRLATSSWFIRGHFCTHRGVVKCLTTFELQLLRKRQGPSSQACENVSRCHYVFKSRVAKETWRREKWFQV